MSLTFHGCATAPAPDETARVKNAELVEIFSSPREATFKGKRGTLHLTYSPEGIQTVKKGNYSDTGTYRIDGDISCGSWKKIRKGKEACTKWYKVGEKSYLLVYTSGEEAGTLTFK
jgi:hypothetical protein